MYLLGGSGVLYFRPACAVGFVALMLPCLRFRQYLTSQGGVIQIAWLSLSTRRMDPGQRGERTIF